MNISRDGAIEVLADEAEALKFKLTDGVDVAKDGTVYFTDASYKYNLHEFFQDIMEGRPRGRLISFDPISKRPNVLLTDLYFANGIAVSPHQDCVIFCETPMYVFFTYLQPQIKIHLFHCIYELIKDYCGYAGGGAESITLRAIRRDMSKSSLIIYQGCLITSNMMEMAIIGLHCLR